MAEDGELADVMAASVRFVMLRRGGLPGYYKVPEAKVLLAETELDRESFVGGSLRVLPRAWATKFNAVYGKALAEVAKVAPPPADAVPAVIPGVSVVRADRVDALRSAVDKIQADNFAPLVAEFVAAYPGVLEDIRAKVETANPTAWARLERRIPTAAAVRANARLALDEIPISFVGEAGRKVAHGYAMQIVNGLAEALGDEVARVADRVAQKGTFKEGTFTELRRQFELLREFDFLATATQKSALAAAEGTFKALGQDPHLALNASLKTGTAVAAGLAKVLGDLSAECRRGAAAGPSRRAIELD